MLYRKARLGWSTGPSKFWVAEYGKAATTGDTAAAVIAAAPDGSLWYAREYNADVLISEIATRSVYDFGELGTSIVVENVDNNDFPELDVVASDDSVYVVAKDQAAGEEWVIKRAAADLSDVWTRTVEPSTKVDPQGRQKIAIDGSENIYMAFGSLTTIDLVSVSIAGSKVWDARFSNAAYDSFYPCVFADSSNAYLLVDNTNNGTREEVHVVKVDPATPAIVWQQLAYLISGTFDYNQQLLHVDGSGGVYAALTLTDGDVFLVKWDSSGTHQHTKRLTSGNIARAGGMGSDGSDNLYFLISDLTDETCELIKFNSAGTIVWQKRISGPSGKTSFIGNGVAVDSDLVYCQIQDTSGPTGGTVVNDYILCLSVDNEEDYGAAVGCIVDGAAAFSVSGSGLTVAAGTLSLSSGGTDVASDTITTTSASGWLTTDRGLL